MKKIVLSLQRHKDCERIFIFFDYDYALVKKIKEVPGALYSNTAKSWHIPLVKELVITLRDKVKDIAVLDLSNLKKQLELKNLPAFIQEQNELKVSAAVIISQNNQAAINKYIETLILKQYSQSTVKTYRNEFLQLLKVIKEKPVQDLTIDHIRRYMHYCLQHDRISEATANSRINAIKFYFEQVLFRDRMFIELPRPKKRLQLPKVLGERELSRLFNALANLKHKAILFTAYSAGLRVSEVVSLQLKHIDSDRMQLFIEDAKGKKDRYVRLSPLLLDILRVYIKNCKNKPVKFLFESEQPGISYSTRSAQEIFRLAKAKAGIIKDVSFHALRHSFATHLLEKGIDVIYIQNILGHFDIKTTQRYLHVRNEQLVTIVSPLDDLWKKGGITL